MNIISVILIHYIYLLCSGGLKGAARGGLVGLAMSGLYALYNNWDHLKGRSPSHYWGWLRAQTMDLFWLWAYSYSLSPPFGDASNFFFFKKPMDHHMFTDFFRVTLGVIFKWMGQTPSSCVDYVAWLLCTVLQAHVFFGVSCSWRKSVSFNDVVLSVLIVDWCILSVVTKLSASSLRPSKIKWYFPLFEALYLYFRGVKIVVFCGCFAWMVSLSYLEY